MARRIRCRQSFFFHRREVLVSRGGDLSDGHVEARKHFGVHRGRQQGHRDVDPALVDHGVHGERIPIRFSVGERSRSW